jgi:hypothetical protein
VISDSHIYLALVVQTPAGDETGTIAAFTLNGTAVWQQQASAPFAYPLVALP